MSHPKRAYKTAKIKNKIKKKPIISFVAFQKLIKKLYKRSINIFR